MKKSILVLLMFASTLFLFTSCKKDDAITPNQKIAASDASNEFTITGDGYNKDKAVIDTTIHPYGTVALGRFPYNTDSLEIRVEGTAVLNGVTKNVDVRIVTSFKGLGTYQIEGFYYTFIGISFLETVSGQVVYSKNYRCETGTMEITKAALNGYIEGTYSGDFIVDDNSSNIVTITNGQFVAKLK